MKFPHTHKQTVFFEKTMGSRRQGKVVIVMVPSCEVIKQNPRQTSKTIDK